MLKYNFKYEIKSMFRNRWIQVIIAILLITFLFAAYNGKQKVEKRNEVLTNVKASITKSDQEMLYVLDSIEKGHTTSVSRWVRPSLPIAVGNYHPRVAALEPLPLAFISVGQSDIYSHYVKPNVSEDDFLMTLTELTSPVQLLFGNFDLAFVLIYLLPLVIIAFTYNVLSGEKEQGSLRLLASQPISIYKWLAHKLLVRFFILAIISTFLLVGIFFINQVSIASNFNSFIEVWGLVMLYQLFWFTLAFFANFFGNSSSKNAMNLLSLWVVLVLLVPSAINLLGNTIYPIPPRIKLINQIRDIKAEMGKKQDKILDSYLRDHPELAVQDNTLQYGYWHKYMASQNLMKKELKPVLNSYDSQLEKQQQWVTIWQYVSPAILMQRSLNALAGTSKEHYRDYKSQVVGFSEQWRQFFIPMLYKNKNFTTNDYQKLPQFDYRPLKNPIHKKSLMVISIMSVVLLLLGYWYFKQKQNNGKLIL